MNYLWLLVVHDTVGDVRGLADAALSQSSLLQWREKSQYKYPRIAIFFAHSEFVALKTMAGGTFGSKNMRGMLDPKESLPQTQVCICTTWEGSLTNCQWWIDGQAIHDPEGDLVAGVDV